MHTLNTVSRFLDDPAVVAVLGAVTLAGLVAVRRDFFWCLREQAESSRLARIERRSHDADGRRLPLGSRR